MEESTATVKEAFRQLDDALATQYSVRERQSMTYLVFRQLLNCSRIGVHEQFNANLSYSQQIRIKEIILALQKNKPLQYVLGETEFYGLTLRVGPGVLIPRQETEELAAWIISENNGREHLHILDIGTGSGCIALALAKNFPDALIAGTDISVEAIEYALQNAGLNDCNAHFYHQDIFTEDVPAGAPFHIIVSNPPYVTEHDKKDMARNVLDYEPAISLFVASQDPLLYYRRILERAGKILLPGGKIYFETHERYGTEVGKLLSDAEFSEVMLRKDIHGKDRMVSGIYGPGRP